MEAYFRMRNIVTDFYILRQRHRQLRAQIRKSIVSYLRQLHLLSQRVAKRSKFTYSASTVHVHACMSVYFYFIKRAYVHLIRSIGIKVKLVEISNITVYGRNGRFRFQISFKHFDLLRSGRETRGSSSAR